MGIKYTDFIYIFINNFLQYYCVRNNSYVKSKKYTDICEETKFRC